LRVILVGFRKFCATVLIGVKCTRGRRRSF
jgi:hypothetical protein